MRTSCVVAGLQAAALLACPTVLSAQDPPREVGFVVSVDGEWFVTAHPSQPLAVGQVLAEGDSVRAGGRKNATQTVSIALYGNGGRLELDCSKQGECDQPRAVSGSGVGTLRGRLEAILLRFRNQPQRFRPFRSRTSSLVEAVVVRGPEGLDLTPALRGSEPEELRLELAPLDSAGRAGPPRPLRVSWTPGAPALVRDTVPTGLYVLKKAEGGRENYWVLVVDGTAASPPEAAAAFAELSGALGEWKSGAGRDDARTLLRAYLYDLAFGGTPAPGPAQ